jgi:hypothetical protein
MTILADVCSMSGFFEFENQRIPYGVFLRDLAAHLVRLLKEERNDPEFISQRKAYEIFGRRNVERWRKAGKIKPYKRPGKLEYVMADLRLLQRTEQDYLSKAE